MTTLDDVQQEIARLRKTLLKQGHAQELLHDRLVEEVRRTLSPPGSPSPPPAPPPPAPPPLAPPQLRALLELDQALLQLLRLAREELPAANDAPRSLREGLDFLLIRVRNLQRSFSLEPIETRQQPFDDRLHQAQGVCHDPSLPDGQVAEEILPGYRLHGRVLRPALVLVNRRSPNS